MSMKVDQKLTPERLMQFGFAYAPPFIIGAAVSNKVFDTLSKEAQTVEEVSKVTGASPRGLRAIMNALVGLELLRKSGEAEERGAGSDPCTAFCSCRHGLGARAF